MLFTIRTLFKTKIVGFFNYLLGDSLALFSLFFSLLYSFVAGFTSFNFGALDRYKIPALPFFMISLVVINYRHKLSFGRSVRKITLGQEQTQAAPL